MMQNTATRSRLWFYRSLILILCALMLLSFITPWWTANLSIVKEPDAIRIYGWGLRHSLVQLRQYIMQDETPLYQTVLAWIYIAVSISLILLSAWLKGKKGTLLALLAGLGYLAYALIAVFLVITPRLAQEGIVLQGQVVKAGLLSNFLITSSLRWGYYLACGAGVMCVITALARSLITGKTPPPDIPASIQ
jgi:hypothetical protein